jgi:hypothetical protein
LTTERSLLTARTLHSATKPTLRGPPGNDRQPQLRRATRPRHVGIGRAWRTRRLGIGAVALGLLAAGCGISFPDFPHPPRRFPVATVLVSANGRVITAVGGKTCGHDPRLVARSYPDKVTLVWVNPDTNCNAETARPSRVRIMLPEPLGNRLLVHASGSGRIPYFSQRDFVRVTVLPAGYRLSMEVPAGQPVGDRRTYSIPPGTDTAGTHRPCPCAQLVIWQQVLSKGFILPTQQTSQRPIHVQVHGRSAELLVNGPLDARSVNWAEHGYYFTVGVAYGPDTAPLTNAQLIAVADGIQPSPGMSWDDADSMS